MAETTILIKGPIFDQRGTAYAIALGAEITDRVSSYALEAVQRNLHGSIRHPTPYYETQINRSSPHISGYITERSINDRGVIYGPWLEGTGSRNQTTRFKGYASFRKAATQTQIAVPGLSAMIIKKYLNRMNGD